MVSVLSGPQWQIMKWLIVASIVICSILLVVAAKYVHGGRKSRSASVMRWMLMAFGVNGLVDLLFFEQPLPKRVAALFVGVAALVAASVLARLMLDERREALSGTGLST